MMTHRLRFLSARDIGRALPMSEAIAAMKEAFRQISAGEAVVPPRTHIGVASPPGDALDEKIQALRDCIDHLAPHYSGAD
jgi:ornithine cyclodeaminase/alanine dehydrogenase-like protein (mu-crystallin family)